MSEQQNNQYNEQQQNQPQGTSPLTSEQLNSNQNQQMYMQQQMVMQQNNIQEQYFYQEEHYWQPEDQPILQRIHSAQNMQYQMGDLTTRIMKEVDRINQESQLGIDWSLIGYCACGWRKDLWETLFLAQKHKSFIHYTDKYMKCQGDIGKGACDVCGEEDKTILRNICGHEFCADCWKQHIFYRLQTQFRDPFPPCMSSDCQIKVSFTLYQSLFGWYPQLKQKFFEVLCRSYATYNKTVKMCKGRPGITCNRCFAIDKMFDIIECSTCGNFVCPRCGQQNHGATICYEISNWRKLTQDSTQFIQFLNYRICPNCKQAVERKQGCNSIICKCKQQFCYVCGEKWLPNHSAHGDQTCYKFKEIKVLNEQKKKKKENGKQYFQKIQDRKSRLDSISMQFQRVDKLKRNDLPNIVVDLIKNFSFYQSQLSCLKQFCAFLQKGLCVEWGQILSAHFKQDKGKQFFLKMLDEGIGKVSNFIFDQIEKMYKLLNRDTTMMSKPERQFISKEGLQRFQQQYPRKVQEIKQIIARTQKYIQNVQNPNA